MVKGAMSEQQKRLTMESTSHGEILKVTMRVTDMCSIGQL